MAKLLNWSLPRSDPGRANHCGRRLRAVTLRHVCQNWGRHDLNRLVLVFGRLINGLECRHNNPSRRGQYEHHYENYAASQAALLLEEKMGLGTLGLAIAAFQKPQHPALFCRLPTGLIGMFCMAIGRVC